VDRLKDWKWGIEGLNIAEFIRRIEVLRNG